jgi:hypothetical protein
VTDDASLSREEKRHRALTELLVTLAVLGVLLVLVTYLFLGGEPLPLFVGLGLVGAAIVGAAARPYRKPAPGEARPVVVAWGKWIWIAVAVIVVALVLLLAIGVPVVP